MNNIDNNVTIDETLTSLPKRPRTNDPQIKLTGTLKQGEHTDTIVFSLRFLMFELVFIVTIPPEGETHAPVYVKHKLISRRIL